MQQSLWALAAAASFSLMAVIVKLSSGEFDPLELVFYRSLFGIASIVSFVKAEKLTLRTKYLKHHFIRSFLGVLSVAIWFFTLREMTFGTNMTLIYTTPIFMAANFVLLAFMHREKAPWVMAISIITGFIGITMMLKPEFHEKDFVPGLLCLLVSFIDLLVYWQMKRMGRLGEPSWRIVFYFCVLGALFAFAGQYVFADGFYMPSSRGFACIVGIGILATLGQLCTTRAYAYGNLLLSSCLGFSAIPFSAVFGWLIFDDAISANSVAAMLIILTSGMTAAVYTKKMEARISAQPSGKGS